MGEVPVCKPNIIHLSKEGVRDLKEKNSEELIERNSNFWRKLLKDKQIKKVVAPMVDQSELAFRVMMKKYGADLTYTPMIHAHLFVNDTTYRKNALTFSPEDRPVIVQFCANDPQTFLKACSLVEDFCDGVDLNLGCPQMVAKRGHYGAYLQEEIDLVCDMVSLVRDYCTLPISCKVRILPCPKKTLDYANRLVEAGASMLAVHGRTREMKGTVSGIADWSRIRQIVEAVNVPVIANGNIQMPGDVDRCLEATKAIAVMSAEGILYNPLLFAETHGESWKIALEYLDYAENYEAQISAIRAHIFRILHHSLLEFDDLRTLVSCQNTIASFRKVIEEVRDRVTMASQSDEKQQDVRNALDYFEKIKNGEAEMDPISVCRTPHWISKPYFRFSEEQKKEIVSKKPVKRDELKSRAEDLGISIKQMKKRERRKLLGQKLLETRKLKYPPCENCGQPGGQGCKLKMCKKCCKYKCKTKLLDCPTHKSKFSKLE
ncbi:unnamed protein product [Auanema sp. JU1783]|nr:unnamed protein product [Auanema sp. JU1783]